MNPLISPSINAAAAAGQSLALIKPRRTRFVYKLRSSAELENAQVSFNRAFLQKSFLDKELPALKPTPYEFRFTFSDDVDHNFANGDWEAHAMFYNQRKRGKSDHEILDWMDHVFNVEYPRQGMLFAVGNQAKRPQTWQLLGVLKVEEPLQGRLDF